VHRRLSVYAEDFYRQAEEALGIDGWNQPNEMLNTTDLPRHEESQRVVRDSISRNFQWLVVGLPLADIVLSGR
jgi:hypothetical protein